MKPATKEVLKLSIPVAMGYIPFGIIFGVLWSRLGYPWYFATLLGLFVLAGSAQFLLITLLASAATIGEIFVATLLLNLRHIFYGLSIAPVVHEMSFVKQFYLAFALTDETYAVISHSAAHENKFLDSEYMMVAALHHSYWVVGCTLGAFVGQKLVLQFRGLEFVLTALFTVLFIEQFRILKNKSELIVPLVVGLACVGLFPKHMLLTAIASSITWVIYSNRKTLA